MAGKPVEVGRIVGDVPDQLARELILCGKAEAVAVADEQAQEQPAEPQSRRGRKAER